MQENTENKSEKTFHYLIVGTNNARLREAINKALEEDSQGVDKVFDLTTSEMMSFTQKRAEEQAEEQSVNFLTSQKTIERCKGWVITLSQNLARNQAKNQEEYKSFLEIFEKNSVLPFVST